MAVPEYHGTGTSRTPSRPTTPVPTFEATPVPLPVIHDPPTLLTLPVHASHWLHVTANLITREPFAPWLPDFHDFIRKMIALHPPPIAFPSPAQISDYLATNSYIVALCNTFAIGYVLFTEALRDQTTSPQPSIAIDLIHVHPAHRRRGAAAALLREVACFATRRGSDSLQTMTPATPDLVAFWKSQGFVEEHDAATTATGPHVNVRMITTPRRPENVRPGESTP